MTGPAGLSAPGIAFCLCLFCALAPPGQAESLSDAEPADIPSLIATADEYFANIHKDMTGLAKAVRLYEQILEKQPDLVDARWKLAEVLFISAMENDDKSTIKTFYEQSLAQAEKALAVEPSCVPALFYCGCAHVSLADMVGVLSAVSFLKTGKRELRRVMTFAPDNRFGILAACVLSQVNAESPWPMKDLDEAEKLARQAVGWDPGLTMAGTQLATVYWLQEEFDAARAEARRCLEIARPTYMSDAILWDWPAAREILAKVKEKTGR
jgi:tetratricopeptide (TPR) repeat protein